MSNLRTMTRASVEQPEPLAFDREPTITIHAQLDGWPIDVAYHGRIEQLPAALQRLSAAGLTPPTPTASPASPQRAPRAKVEPKYNHAGDPCCPVHHKPLKEGQYGLYCSAKDPEGKNGYCSLKFT